MSKLQFRIGQTEDGKPVKLDLETFIHTRAALFANSGGGKTTTLYTLIERSIEKVPWIIVDPEGEYSPLRELFPTMLLVGKDGEVPVDLRSAKLLARKIMELRLSTIIDLYSLIEIRAEWVAEFITALINLPKDLWSPTIVAIDEGHRLAPETPTGDKRERDALYRSRKAIITLSDSGRKQHRGAIVATQRVAKMAMDARAELRNTFTGLQVRDNDRKRAGDDLGFSKEQTLTLRDLAPGQFYVYGPALIGVRGVEKIQIDLSQTKPPRVGTKDFDIPPASDALKELVDQMGDLPKIATAEMDTVAAMKKRIFELENQLRARPVQIQPKIEKEVKTVEVPILKDAELRMLESSIKSLSQIGADAINYGQQVIASARDLGQQMQAATRFKTNAVGQTRAIIPTARPAVAGKSANQTLEQSNTDLRGGERLILIATAQYRNGVSREQLTVLSGYKRSSRDTYLQRLTQRGFVATSRDRIAATPEGISALGNDFQPLPTGQALVEYWLNRLSGGERAIFEIVVRAYPDEVLRDDLMEKSGYKRSSRDTYIQRLQARELVTTNKGTLRASDHLFE